MNKPAMAAMLSLCLIVPAFAGDEVDPNGGLPQIEWRLAEPGETYDGLPAATPAIAVEQTDIDPGTPPEGDYIGQVVYSRDGDRVFVSNRITDNISVFDANTYALLATIDVGTQPCYMDASDDYLVVSCSFSDEVWVIELADYSTAAVFETAEQPWTVHVSDDGTRAWAACDIPDVLEVFDLTNLTHIASHSNFPIYLSSFSWNSESGRSSVKYSDFLQVPGTDLLMAADLESGVQFFNAETGEVDQFVPGITDCRAIALSGGGEVGVALSNVDPVTLYQIDLNTFTTTDSQTVPGHSASFFGLGANADGSKAYLGVNGNMSALVDFADDDYVLFGQTYTAFWVDESYDHEYVISGQYRFSIIDFASESIAGSYWGYSQYGGVASPVDYTAIGFSALTHEGLYHLDYTDPGSISFDDSMISGEPPEGDAPRRAAISPDGSLAVVSNVISDNVTILDLDSGEPEAYFEIGDRVQDVAITPDGHYAVVSGFNAQNRVHIIDLETMDDVAQVVAGSRPGVVSISPDGQYAYVGNISSNSVSVIEIDGANSSELVEIPTGVIGVVWAAYGVSSDVEVTADGEHVLVACSFDDLVYVIDADTWTTAATLPTGDFPIQIAVDASGEYAVVTNYFSDTATLMHIDGTNSSVVATVTPGDGPLRCAYNPAADEFGIGNYYDSSVTMIEAQTGSVTHTEYFSQFGSMLQVGFMNDGELVAMTGWDGSAYHLHHGEGDSELPASPSYFAINPAQKKVLACMPGPDWVSLFAWELDPVTLALIPANPPVVIPAAGGSFEYGATLANNTDTVLPAQAWTKVTLPNGNEVGPLMLVGFNLAPGTVNPTGLTQNVPFFAPAGMYTFTGYVGYYGPGFIAATDSFPFEKLAPGTSGVGDWSATAPGE